jgi:hypothetical protein
MPAAPTKTIRSGRRSPARRWPPPLRRWRPAPRSRSPSTSRSIDAAQSPLLAQVAPLSIAKTSLACTSPTNNNVIVTDALPTNLSLFVGTSAPGPGPVRFTAGSSGLTYSFTSLANAADDLEFSHNGGASWTYVPTIDANTVDVNVILLRIRPKGSMVPGSSFTINLRGSKKATSTVDCILYWTV